MGFRTVAGPAAFRQTIKGSVFEGRARRVPDAPRAEAWLDELRAEHPDANHVCFAYRCGAQQRFSDDGEPGGTAGRPIFEVLQHRELDHVVVAVVRWFGGTLLGAGGLARAYRGTAAMTLDRAGETEVLDTETFAVEVPFDAMDATLRLLQDHPRTVAGAPSFTPRGMVVRVTVEAAAAPALRDALVERTRGEANFIAST